MVKGEGGGISRRQYDDIMKKKPVIDNYSR